MHAALAKLQADWMALRPYAEKLPAWLTPPARKIEALPADAAEAAKVVACRADIDAHCNTAADGTRTTFRQRREVGERLADYLRDAVLPVQDQKRPSLVPEQLLKLRACRHGGAWGVDGGTGKVVIAWDSKCGMTLLCPHCARTEQRRLVRRYKDPMKAWKQGRPTRRIHSGVMTWPNVTAGDLHDKLRAIFKHFAKVARAFPSIKGHLATVEAPLSARGDWNLHLNVLLCVEGPLHWAELRQAWHAKTKHLFPGYEGTDFQVELRQLPRYDDDALDAALRELIKYPAKHVTEKANGKALRAAEPGEGEPVALDDAPGPAIAPAMIDWPPDRFLEWWDGHRRFRRTRSYGCMFGESLDELSGDVEDRPRGEVVWYGRVWWDRLAQAYAVSGAAPVGLIQANNSTARAGPPGAKSAQETGSGPPGPEPGPHGEQLSGGK